MPNPVVDATGFFLYTEAVPTPDPLFRKRRIIMSPNKVKVKPYQCPDCQNVVDAASSIDGQKLTPRVGDFTVCALCGAVLRYGETDFERADPDALKELPQDQRQAIENLSWFFKRLP